MSESLSSPGSNAKPESPSSNQEFAREADTPPPGLLREIADYLIDSRKWWLTPIVVALLLLGGLVFLSSTAIAPFIYPVW